jgi:hypothetical protein
MQSRRALLAAAISILVGGCTSDPPATEQSPSPTTTTTPSSESPPATTTPGSESPTESSPTETETPECTRGYTLRVSPFAPTEQLVTGFRPARQRLVDRVLADGRVVFESYGQRPVRTAQHTPSDGTYYRIDYEQIRTEEVDAACADLSWEKGQQAPDGETVVDYSELPDVDQHALDYLIHGPAYSRDQLPQQGMSISDSPAPYPDGTAASVLVDAGTTWVEWDSRVYKVTIASADKTITRRTFEYTATRVADSPSGFRTYAADQYLRVLDGLGAEAQAVLEAAIEAGDDGRYEECNDPSDAYTQLQDKLESLPELPDPLNNHWYIAYERTRYLVVISGWVV